MQSLECGERPDVGLSLATRRLATYAAFSPDGQRVVAASDDQTAQVRSALNGQLLATLRGHSAFVQNAVFSPDGQRTAELRQCR